jgi:hypothetical protein
LNTCVDAAAARGGEHGGIGAAIGARRRAQHALRAARELRRHRHHDHGGGQWRGAGGHIQTRRPGSAVQPLAAHAGHRLDRQRRGQLRGMEAADVVDRRFDGAICLAFNCCVRRNRTRLAR